jgi:hypothetical protein
MSNLKLNNTMRTYHRYLGFFLAGIMAVYALSGILMIFRNTDFLKSEKLTEKKFPADIKVDELGSALKLRDFKIEREENGVLYFKQGTFSTGVARVNTKEWPMILQKMTKMHKATSADPLFFLNIFFGLSLLFFVISAFWMFLPNTDLFKKGLYFTIGGIILTLILLFI